MTSLGRALTMDLFLQAWLVQRPPIRCTFEEPRQPAGVGGFRPILPTSRFRLSGIVTAHSRLIAVATLNLPSFNYRATGASGVLSRDLLATWLLGSTNLDHTDIDSARVEAMFGYLQAAGRRTLPPPNHHGHSFGYESEELLRGRIQHFRLGYGVGSYVYLWIAVWTIGNLVAARRYWH